jgi:hypothetical protein
MRYVLTAAALISLCVAAVHLYQVNEARNQRDKERFVYDKVLEAIVVKQRDELFKRGYATDDSVCIGDPFFAQGWCAEHYGVKK